MLGLHYYSSLKVTLVTFLLSVLLTVSSSRRSADAFVVSRAPSFRTRLSFRTSLNMMSTDSSLVVISPPGGVGEVTAVKAATMGAHVKWFVVSNNNNSSSKLQLSPYSLDSIQHNNGSIDLAGCDVDSVNESLQAIQLYCRESNALVCTTDGIDNVAPGKLNEQDPVLVWKNAIKIAAKQAAESIKKGGIKVVILSVDDEEDEEEDGKQGNLLLKSLFKSGSGVDIPSSLSAAMGGGDKNVIKIRHGELFGIPESSPNFSALTGGPLKDAILCEEYTMRSVRMDPSQTLSGSVSGLNSRSSRHAIGEAAALFALQKLASNNNLDVCVTSLRGIDPVSMETWEDELERVKTMIQSGQGAPLFTASFSSVPDVERLADWLATKWAPAVMRTYDIAAIRVGARPVYATRIGDSQVEIVWQQLDNFESVTAGKMLIDVSNDGIVATRAAGDASKGYGTVSRKPLAGENVLVSKLADAASQAIEKGLAKKPATAKKPKPEKKKVEVAVPVSSVQASGTVQAAAAEPSLESGPRTAGARRSSERARGSKRTKKTAAGASDDDSAFQ